MKKAPYVLFRYYPDRYKLRGFYDSDNGEVHINKAIPKIVRELTFAHENQHKICHQGKCSCWNKDTEFWCEYHAFRAEFEFILSKNSNKYWIAYFESVVYDLKKYKRTNHKPKSWPDHFRALAKICRTKEFASYARGYGYHTRIMDIIDRGIIICQ